MTTKIKSATPDLANAAEALPETRAELEDFVRQIVKQVLDQEVLQRPNFAEKFGRRR